MSELTKEFFEEKFKGVATKEDLKSLATKTDLENQTDQLGIMINNAFQDQKDYMEGRFVSIKNSPQKKVLKSQAVAKLTPP